MTTNTKELLQLAALAAGREVKGLASKFICQGVSDHALVIANDRGGDSVFDPATNSGDSRDLQVALKISLEWLPSQKVWMAWGVDCKGVTTGDDHTDPNMAVLLVASELGKAMEGV